MSDGNKIFHTPKVQKNSQILSRTKYYTTFICVNIDMHDTGLEEGNVYMYLPNVNNLDIKGQSRRSIMKPLTFILKYVVVRHVPLFSYKATDIIANTFIW